MKKIIIEKTTNLSGQNFTEEDVLQDTKKHKRAVEAVCEFFADSLIEQSHNHDRTKLDEYLPVFTRALKTGFKDDEIANLNWLEFHITEERHHLGKKYPKDVNLIDVIEMLADCVTAGLARNGEVYKVEIDPKILAIAIENTVAMFIDNIKVSDDIKQKTTIKFKGIELEEGTFTRKDYKYGFKLYDLNGNEIYWENSSGYWCKWERDNRGNVAYWENSKGNWWKRKYDEQGNPVYRIDSKGNIWRKEEC